MWVKFLAFFASTVGRYILIGTLVSGGAYFGVKWVNSTLTKAANHDLKVEEINRLNKELFEQESDHQKETEQLAADRATIANALNEITLESKQRSNEYNILLERVPGLNFMLQQTKNLLKREWK